MAKKLRADQLLFEQGLTDSREKAKRLIMAGRVFRKQGRGEEKIAKAGCSLPVDTVLRISEAQRFVSRGGYKLLTAIEHFNLDLSGRICLDVGASTGGFTHCLLEHGAQKIYAVDVGYGQLDTRLRHDTRVISLEKVNIRHADYELIGETVNFVSADVSFISLTKVVPACLQFMAADCLCVFLVKPQFEVGPGGTVRGVVRDKSLRKTTVDKVIDFMVNKCQLDFVGTVASRLKGPKGNQEYLCCLKYRNIK